MKIIDLSHPVSEDMPVYPGTEKPVLDIGCSLEKDGFLEKKMTLFSHTGTHIDAPAHLLRDAPFLDDFAVDKFYGRAVVLDVASGIKEIGIESVKALSELLDDADFLLIRTGWSRYWGEDKYFENYPVLSGEAAALLSSYPLKAIGLDVISADPVDDSELPRHRYFLKNNICIVENLLLPDSLPGNGFNFSCFPLKIKDADGSPVRAVAYCP